MTVNGSGPITWAQFEPWIERVTRLEEKHAGERERKAGRSNRTWVLITLLISGLICPVVVTTVIAVLHLRH